MILPQIFVCFKSKYHKIVLEDKTPSGRYRDWSVAKQCNQLLAETFEDLGQEKRAQRVYECASYLEFWQCISNTNHPKKLKNANFCNVRLCPLCQRRKSFRQFAVAVKIAHELLERKSTYQFVLLTLTVPNIELESLGKTITHLLESWHRLTQRAEVKRAIRGYLRTLEVSYNHQRNDWHPHIHVALVVASGYFKTKDYIKHERWLEMWRESTRQSEITQVDIRKIKPNPKREGNDAVVSGFAEVAKYALKPWSDAIEESELMKTKEISRQVKGHAWIRPTREETAQVVNLLDSALYKRRLVQYGGMLKEIKAELKLKDGEDEGADLVNTSDDKTECKCAICQGDMKETWYIWEKQFKNYYLAE